MGLSCDIMQTMNAYTEYSPSGKGLRILFTVPDTFQYDKARYRIKVVGDLCGLVLPLLIPPAAKKALPLQQLREVSIMMVLEKYMCRPERQIPQQAPKEPAELDDLQLIEKARRSKGGPKFTALWSGDASS